MPINFRNHHEIRTLSNNILKCVEDYKYLGSHIQNSEKDFNIRKGIAWTACNKMNKIWKSNLCREVKIRIFRILIEPILLYGSETWTLSARQQRRLDGCYTRLLMRVLDLSWRNHPTLEMIYGDLPRVSTLVCKRRVQWALCTCFRWTCVIVCPLEAPIIKEPFPETNLSRYNKTRHRDPWGESFRSYEG